MKRLLWAIRSGIKEAKFKYEYYDLLKPDAGSKNRQLTTRQNKNLPSV
jgi:hypothetical protein